MYITNEAPWFSFLVHPRDVPDLDTMRGISFLRKHTESEEEFVRKACSMPPLLLGDVLVGASAVRGEVVGAVRLPEELLSPRGQQVIVEAAQLAASRGSRVIGLGALTAPATIGGTTLLRHLPSDVAVTNGNGYTALVAWKNVNEACALTDRSGGARVAVLGCTGSVGVAASHLLAEDGHELVLIGPSQARVRKLFGDLADRVLLSDDIEDLRKADVVLVLTSHPTAKLTPDRLRDGAVVIDVAQPANIPDAEIEHFRARGTTVAKGALVRIPGYRCTQDFRLPEAKDTFACLAETYLLSREGRGDHSVGWPSADYARHLDVLARRHGVTPTPLDLHRRTPSASLSVPSSP